MASPRPDRARPFALLAVCAALVASCADPPPPVVVELLDPVGLERHFGFWRPEIDATGARIRVDQPPTELRVHCPDGGEHPFTPPADGQPARVCPGVEPGASGELRLLVDGHIVARLPVRRAPAEHAALKTIAAARRADPAEARRLIERAAAAADGPPAYALALERARLLAPDPAAYRAAAAAAAHRPLDAARALRLGAHRLLWAQRYPDAGALAEEARVTAAAVDHRVGVALGHYYLGLVDQQLGRFRQAERHLEHAAAGVRAAGRGADAVGFELARANLLQDRGHHRAALERLDVAAADLERLGEHGAALRPYFAVDAGWIRLRAMIAGHLEPDYRGLMAHFAAIDLPPGPRRANAAANRALAALRAGALPDARAALDAARAADPRAAGFSAAFVDLLEIELALAEGDPQRALTLCTAQADRIEAGAAHLRWRRWLLQGRAHRALGDRDAADAAWRAGLDAIRAQASGVGAARGRSAFHADRQAVVDALVDLRLDRGDVAGAFAVADEARLQVLRGTASRLAIDRLDPSVAARWSAALSDWRRARDAFEEARFDGDGLDAEARNHWLAERAREQQRIQGLFDAAEAVLQVPATPAPVTPETVQAALGEGAALIAFARRDAERWVGLYIDGRRVEARPIDPADPLAPWAAALPALSGLMIVDGGLPAARDLPPAPDGRPWTAQVPIGWLPAAGLLAESPTPGAAPPVVIADPTGDLPHARAEGRALAEQTGARLIEGATAREDRVTAALRDARWLHYAGHGSPGEDGPWDARLLLADGVELTAVELMLARAAPRIAILSACRTIRRGALASAEPWGLPEVLVALGSRSVLAADVLLDDAAARRFVERFHAAGGVDAPGPAFRDAVAGSIAVGDEGWKGWRLIGRP